MSAVLASVLAVDGGDHTGRKERAEPEIVSFEDSDSGFWPYLNSKEAHEKRSPLNVVVRGDTDRVVRLLARHGEGDWEEAEHDHFEAEELFEPGGPENGSAMDPDGDGEANTTVDEVRPVSPTDIPWSEADGTTRYAYVDPGPDEDTYWTTETTQLEDGEYYGYRYHIRLYESPNPDDRWVVMQTHSEHFDWFTLRHRVDGVEDAQSRLEADLMAIPSVDIQEDVQRIYLDNAGPPTPTAGLPRSISPPWRSHRSRSDSPHVGDATPGPSGREAHCEPSEPASSSEQNTRSTGS